MNKAFEKILEMLEENQTIVFNLGGGKPKQSIDYSKAVEIVQEVAEEYKSTEYINCSTDTSTNTSTNGWIPCSERLPEDDSICIVTVEYPNNETVVDYGWFDRKSVCWFVGIQEFITSNILAWQPLPEPFKERD